MITYRISATDNYFNVYRNDTESNEPDTWRAKLQGQLKGGQYQGCHHKPAVDSIIIEDEKFIITITPKELK